MPLCRKNLDLIWIGVKLQKCKLSLTILHIFHTLKKTLFKSWFL